MDNAENFLAYMLYERRCSPLTIKAYRNDLNLFATFLSASSLGNITNATSRLVRRWMMHLLSTGYVPRSVNRKIASLRSFYRYLCRMQILTANPCNAIVSIRGPKKLPVFMQENEAEEMLKPTNFSNDYEGQRDRCILQLFYLTGIRSAELVNIKSSQIDLSLDQLLILGKRNKQRIIPITPVLKSVLFSYLQFRKFKFGPMQPTDTLFLTSKGEPIYPTLVYKIVHQHMQMASSVAKKSPHVLRHTFATVMLNHGADLMAIKELLGHASLAATQIYAHSNFEQLNKIYKQAHPRAEN